MKLNPILAHLKLTPASISKYVVSIEKPLPSAMTKSGLKYRERVAAKFKAEYTAMSKNSETH